MPAIAAEDLASTLTLPPATASLVRVEQHGTDVVVHVGGDATLVIDHPLGRTGPEIFLVGPFDEEAVIEVTAQDQAAGSVATAWSAAPIPAAGPVFEATRRITRAGTLVSQGTKEALESAADAYREAAALGIEAHGLADYAAYLAAAVDFRLFRLSLASAALAGLDAGACPAPPYCYKARALESDILFAQDRYAEARDVRRAALAALQATGLPAAHTDLDRAELLSTLGLAEVFTGDPVAGKAHIDAALVLAERVADDGVLGLVRNDLGSYFASEKDYVRAEVELRNAVEHLRRARDLRSLLHASSNLSRVYMFTGEYAMARKTLIEVRPIAESMPDRSLRGGIYASLGALYEAFGDYENAATFARLAHDADVDFDRIWRSHVSAARVGSALRELGRAEEALRYHERSLAYFREHGPVTHTAATLAQVALDRLELGRIAEARAAIDGAWALRGSESGLLAMSDLVTTRARVLIAEGEPDAALALLRERRDEYAQNDQAFVARVDVARLLMETQRRLGRDDDAIATGREAVRLVSDIRGQLESYRAGPAWSARTYGVFTELTDLLLARYRRTQDRAHAEDAFLVADQGRAVSLMQQRLINARAQDAPESADVVELRRRLAVLGAERVSAYGVDDERFARASRDYQLDLERLRSALESDAPQAGHAIRSVAELQAGIPAGAAIVEYVCVPRADCHAFVLTRDAFGVRRLASYETIATQANDVAVAAQRRLADLPAAFAALGRLLLRDVLPEGVTDVAVVAPAPLDGIPLSALDVAADGDRYVPAVERHAITIVPSAAAYARGAAAGEPVAPVYSADLAIFADPAFEAPDRLAAAAPAAGDSGLRAWADTLERLPWSAKEAEALERLFHDRSVIVYTSGRATRTNLLSPGMRNARIAHIASHAFFDERMPDMVALATAPEAGGGASLVTAEQLFAQPFRSHLVVIAACDTARGQQVAGEGMMSLSRAFMAQGVDHVIATLWPVSDAVSARFMDHFYHALEVDGLPIAHALRAAQRRVREEKRHRLPFYWAGYVLTSAGPES
jgi:tetratricopeptide (TPR) repeat protein